MEVNEESHVAPDIVEMDETLEDRIRKSLEDKDEILQIVQLHVGNVKLYNLNP